MLLDYVSDSEQKPSHKTAGGAKFAPIRGEEC